MKTNPDHMNSIQHVYRGYGVRSQHRDTGVEHVQGTSPIDLQAVRVNMFVSFLTYIYIYIRMYLYTVCPYIYSFVYSRRLISQQQHMQGLYTNNLFILGNGFLGNKKCKGCTQIICLEMILQTPDKV